MYIPAAPKVYALILRAKLKHAKLKCTELKRTESTGYLTLFVYSAIVALVRYANLAQLARARDL